MLHLNVLAVDVVQGAVVGLADHGEAPVIFLVGAGFDLGLYQGVAYDTDAVGVGDPDGRRQDAGLPDPHKPRHLPVAVEPVGAGEDRLIARQTLSGTDDGNASPHRPVTNP